MASTMIAPENEEFPHRKRWTREECQQMEKMGVLTGRYELIDGEIIEKMGHTPPHASIIMRLTRWWNKALSDLVLRVQLPVEIPEEVRDINDPELDAVLCSAPEERYDARHPLPEEIVLLMEVSDSTRQFDLTKKAALYSQAGIAEYWVFDVVGRQLVVQREPTQEGYQNVTFHAETDPIAPQSRPNDSILVSELLPTLPSSTDTSR